MLRYIIKGFQRPNDTTAYAANDRIAPNPAALQKLGTWDPRTVAEGGTPDRSLESPFTKYNGLPGAAVMLKSLRIFTDLAAIAPRIRVHFYTGSITLPDNPGGGALPADNAAMLIRFGDRIQWQGSCDFAAMTTYAGVSFAQLRGIDLPIARYVPPIPADQYTNYDSIFYALETLDIFTPSALQTFALDGVIDQVA